MDNFDIRKFLTENKITVASRNMLAEAKVYKITLPDGKYYYGMSTSMNANEFKGHAIANARIQGENTVRRLYQAILAVNDPNEIQIAEEGDYNTGEEANQAKNELIDASKSDSANCLNVNMVGQVVDREEIPELTPEELEAFRRNQEIEKEVSEFIAQRTRELENGWKEDPNFKRVQDKFRIGKASSNVYNNAVRGAKDNYRPKLIAQLDREAEELRAQLIAGEVNEQNMDHDQEDVEHRNATSTDPRWMQ